MVLFVLGMLRSYLIFKKNEKICFRTCALPSESKRQRDFPSVLLLARLLL